MSLRRYVRPEEKLAKEFRKQRAGIKDVQRPTGTETHRTKDVAQQAADDAQDALDLIGEIGDAPVPKPVTGLAVVSNTGAFTLAGAVATVVLEWTPVTESVEDEPVDVVEYEVFNNDQPVAIVSSESVSLMVASGLEASFRVRARADVWGDLSDAVSVTGASPAIAARAPSAPILITGSAVIVARWDGTYATGDLAGALTVMVEARIGTDAWEPQGAALSGAGSQLVRIGKVDDTVQVRLVAYDALGRETGVSAVESVVVEGIDGEDITAGTIHGNRIEVGTLAVDAVEPNFGESLNIFANESVQIIVGRQDDQDTAIADAQQSADQASVDADLAADIGGAAAAAAAAAEGKALVAETLAQSNRDDLTAHQAVFRVTAEGAEVASIDGANVFRMTPDGAQIVQGGDPASTWDAGRLIVNEIIVNHGQLANHAIERVGARTIFRPI